MKRKVLLTAGALALVSALSVAGTAAWLTDSSGEVVNTFTVGSVGITLEETFNADKNGDGTPDAWEVTMVPGNAYKKDPCVTVEDDSENCWLFIKVVENDEGNALDYSINTSNWTAVPGHAGYYYKENAAAGDALYILEGVGEYTDGGVTINGGVTETTADSTLTFTAAAVQQANVADLADAWSKLPGAFTA